MAQTLSDRLTADSLMREYSDHVLNASSAISGAIVPNSIRGDRLDGADFDAEHLLTARPVAQRLGLGKVNLEAAMVKGEAGPHPHLLL